MFTHIRKFLSENSPLCCWPQLFQLKSGLGLKKILHIAEICIVVPLSNAESKQIFSYLWCQSSNEQLSLNHQTLEIILQLQSAGKKIITLKCTIMQLIYFWHSLPMAQLENVHITLTGHNYSKKQYVNEKEQNESTSTSHETPSSIIDLSLPSNSKFSRSEDEM